MSLKSIQQNIKQNTKDFSEYGLWVGGLDISSKNIDGSSSSLYEEDG